MKKITIILLLIIFALSSWGQQAKHLSGDTTYWYSQQLNLEKQLNLDDILKSTNKFEFRLWKYGQFVDIAETDSGILKGSILNYMFKYNPDKDRVKPKDVIRKKINIDTIQLRLIYNLIVKSQLENVPPDSKIKYWERGKDGVTYIFQTSTDSTYSFKSYWEPYDQPDTLMKAKQIVDFLTEMNKILRVDKIQADFLNTLPPGRYTLGDSFMKIVYK